jgi:hypothetical protein
MALEWIDPQVQALQARVAELEQENGSLKEKLCQCLCRREARSQTAADAESRQASLLSTVAQVANLLRSPDYTTVLPDVVRLLGEAVGSDCKIMLSASQRFSVAMGRLECLQEISFIMR